eukprot:m.117307 g.117307  ORF g.117307 m.117307 type:complete len:2031 (-) comp14246_c0_seq3:549-6641(-)
MPEMAEPQSGGFGRMTSLRSHTSMLAMYDMGQQAGNKKLEIASGSSGYGFSLSTQPWLVHGLNHFVSKVESGSNADRAGLKVGDKLLEIDQVVTSSLSHKMVASLLAAAAEQRKPVALVVNSKTDIRDKLNSLSAGDNVEALYAHDGKWYDAIVEQINLDSGSVVVNYTGYDETATLPMSQVRMNDKALPAYWVAAYAGDGEKYYYNTVTNKTSWDFPAPDNELEGVSVEAWAVSEEPETEDMKAIQFGKLNRKYAGVRIQVYPEGEPSFIAYGGTCDFSGPIPADGLKAQIFFDVTNPKAAYPFDLSKNSVAENIQGSVVLVERGDVVISEKVKHCQDAGAIGCIVANTDPELTLFNIGVPGDDSESGLNIVVTNVIYADGLELITALQEGVTTSVVIEDISKEPVPAFFLAGDVVAEDVTGFLVSDIGRAVTIKRKGEKLLGTLAFVGKNQRDNSEMCGIALNSQIGDTDGTVDGVCYFLTEPNAALVATPKKVSFADLVPEKAEPGEIEGFGLDTIGKRCKVRKYGMGTIRFVGLHKTLQEARIGVELDEAKGKNDGTVGGVEYFSCNAKHGLLCPPKFVEVDKPKPERPTKPKEVKQAVKVLAPADDQSDEDEDYDNIEQPSASEALPPLPEGARKRVKSILKVDDRRGSGRRVSFSDFNGKDLTQVLLYEPESSENEDEGSYTLYKAMYDYKSDDPNDLSFLRGDILRVTDEGDGPESWYFGTREEDNTEGSFPGTFVRKLGMGGGEGGGKTFSFSGSGGGDADEGGDVESEEMDGDDIDESQYLVTLDSATIQNAVTNGSQGDFLIRKNLNGDKYFVYIQNEGKLTKTTIRFAEGEFVLGSESFSSLSAVVKYMRTNEFDVSGVSLTLNQPAAIPKDSQPEVWPMEPVPGFGLDAVGRKVTSRKYGPGTIRFVGLHHKKGVPRIGVELDTTGRGKHNGTVHGIQYFNCKDSFGVLVPSEDVSFAEDNVSKVTVTVDRGSGPLGISVIGKFDSEDYREGVFVGKVRKTSPAKGILQAQQRIFSVDGKDTTNVTRQQCVDFLKEAGSSVTFVLSTEPDTLGASVFDATYGNVEKQQTTTKAPPSKESVYENENENNNNDEAEGDDLYENLSQGRSVTIKKGNEPAGILLKGPKTDSDPKGISVAKLKAGSAAEKVLNVGDKIIMVNGKDVKRAMKAEVMQMLKESGAVVRLVIADAGEAPTRPSREEQAQRPPRKESVDSMAGVHVYGDPSEENQATPTKPKLATRVVTINKNGGPLGMTICGKRTEEDNREGVYIQKVKEGGPSIGIVEVAMRIMNINGKDMRFALKSEAVSALKASSDVVTMEVTDPDPEGFSQYDGSKPAVQSPTVYGSTSGPKLLDVKIDKGSAKLGIVISGPKGDEPRDGIFISKIADASPAKGLVKEMQRIYGVNGEDVTLATKLECASAIRKAGDTVILKVSENPINKASPGAADSTPSQDLSSISVTIFKNGPSYGLSLVGPSDVNDQRQGIYISKIKKDGPAHGLVKKKQRILSVNGTDTTNVPKQEVLKLFKGTTSLKLEVSVDQDEAGFSQYAKSDEPSKGSSNAPPSENSSAANPNEITVTLSMDGPLGLGFQGKKNAEDTREGVFISKVKPDSPAAGQLLPMQRILTLNGSDVRNATKVDVVGLIKSSVSTVYFVVTREPDAVGFSQFDKTAVSSTPPDSTPASSEAPTQPPPQPPNQEGPVYEEMGRLKLLKLARERQLDYQSVQKDKDGLIQLLKHADSTGSVSPPASTSATLPPTAPEEEAPVAPPPEPPTDFNPFGAPPPAPEPEEPPAPSAPPPPPPEPEEVPAPTVPPPEPPVASVEAQETGGNPYQGMGRLKMLKIAKERGLEYKQVAKDPVALMQLLLDSDAKGESVVNEPPTSILSPEMYSVAVAGSTEKEPEVEPEAYFPAVAAEPQPTAIEHPEMYHTAVAAEPEAPDADLDVPRETLLASMQADRPRGPSKRPPSRHYSQSDKEQEQPKKELPKLEKIDYSIPEKDRIAAMVNVEETNARLSEVTFDFNFG